MHKIFPISQTIQLRCDIVNFKQFKVTIEELSLSQNARMTQIANILQWFGLKFESRLDGTFQGALMIHTNERSCQIIDNMAMNSYMWPNRRFTYNSKPSTMKATQKVDAYQIILKKLNRLEVATKPTMMEPAQSCGQNSIKQPDEVNYVDNRDGNPYMNTYNSSWKDHPN
ncbi:Retrotransposon gag protein [Gossypium australe]|uniref:Retrotransposon gag protein n=1 Tax=Gossypium australe TaxID=47621 RepID=A0A5B6VBQ1_9ROSI|nr:Retrotransposon gag protein [Gossypium australe]